ncbi:glyceraldehyde 3-phosphate dehydrogenase, C-terminal domain protein [Orientia chuto str. Dubai]|uniref:Glyceraldehyde 3-phosphate dehydrogenase, C-terminal domain protein n=2 Tax=Candidatus Orientia mediorientalis TaxID=911112 RepID=A0A0F3MMP1_9RICK|nr:glyceraldehyde 3-phosphate dehydrogenase, C-terminal domain protein [Orientia chuto str. Dubai]
MRIAVNGLGRIGRLVVRAISALQDSNFKLVAANSLAKSDIIAHLINYDSTHGELTNKFQYNNNCIFNNMCKIKLFKQDNPEDIPWNDEAIDIVIECSGKFNNSDAIVSHLRAGAKRVIVSAPCKVADTTIVVGVNDHLLNLNHKIISAGSCTTNAAAPVIKILNDKFKIECGHITTIHAYTNDQNILDNSHKDFRRARSCSMSIIPTKTGVSTSLKAVIPELANCLDGSAVRVPTSNVSLIDFTFYSHKTITVQSINNEIEESSKSLPMRNILSVTPAPLVSIDFNHSKFSAIFDHYETKVVGKNLGRVIAWYDNEWGFVHRIIDIVKIICCQETR